MNTCLLIILVMFAFITSKNSQAFLVWGLLAQIQLDLRFCIASFLFQKKGLIEKKIKQ